MSEASRALALLGAQNVRDLGGLPTRDGRRTRRGRLLRGDLLTELVEHDVDVLVVQVGLRTVVDLRSKIEARRHPVDWDVHGVVWRHCPFPIDPRHLVPWAKLDRVAGYLSFLAPDPRALLEALTTLMDPASQPALFHCAAGKDRTGVVAALLLDVLGVDHETIAEDYALTTAALEPMFERLMQLELYRSMVSRGVVGDHAAHTATMAGFLDRIGDEHGGAEGWLRANGVEQAAIDAFRAALLEG